MPLTGDRSEGDAEGGRLTRATVAGRDSIRDGRTLQFVIVIFAAVLLVVAATFYVASLVPPRPIPTDRLVFSDVALVDGNASFLVQSESGGPYPYAGFEATLVVNDFPSPLVGLGEIHIRPGAITGSSEETMGDPRRLKHRSWEVTEGPERAPARAMMRGMGLSDEDLARPLVGVSNTWNESTPCQLNLDRVARRVKAAVREAGGTPREFMTITVSDGIAMGHEGMRASLVSREVIADSIELMMHAHRYDALVACAACDKSIPGSIMAMARLNVPSIFTYGGPMLPGRFEGRDVTIQDVFEAVGAFSAGTMSAAQLDELERSACPGAGTCAGLFTANTMASCAEALGLTLPGDAAIPQVAPEREAHSERVGGAVMKTLELGIKPRDCLKHEAFENAIVLDAAMGGSTNAVLHLLVIANEAGVPLSLGDFDRIARRTPHIASMKPGGKYVMADLYRAGGVPVVLRRLLDAGKLDGEALTVTGETMAKRLREVP